MNFLRLKDPLLTVLFEDESIIAIDKPYGISSHTNDAKAGNAQYLIPGLIEVFEMQREEKLFIVHRLDRTTSGVFVVAKTPEAAKQYQDYFRHRETKKTYVFITAAKSDKLEFETQTPILHKGDQLSAATKFKQIKTSSKFGLWEAAPLTGRNHQIRIHGAEVGLPLLGDEKYGGAKFPFLNLHNRRIEFPNGIAIESRVPVYFDDLTLLENWPEASEAHERDRRERLYGKPETLRLCHQTALTIDRLGEIEVMNGLHVEPRARTIVHDPKTKKKRALDVPETWTVQENGLTFELRRDSSPPTHGLALEHRLTRRWTLEAASGLSVLSLFSSTGGFALAAAVGGAREITAVDAAKSMLNWARRNSELNGLEPDRIQFLCRDALAYLNQCRSKKTTFDLIIADPPNFARTDEGVFRIEEAFPTLIEGCLDRLSPGGRLLFATASESLSFETVERTITKAKRTAQVSILQASLDFNYPGERTRLKSFLATIS